MNKPPCAPKAAIGRFEALDSLRGICACMVVLLHFHTRGHIGTSQFVNHGFLFVDFFFVLSGFVISASYRDKLSSGFPAWKFMFLRLGRVYPLHLTMLVVFLAFEAAYAAGLLGQVGRPPFTLPNDIPSFLSSALLVQIFLGPDMIFWNGPSWSIAAEAWAYLLFALVVSRAPRFANWIAVATAFLCVLYLSMLTNRYINVFHDGALARCLFGFSLGMIAFELQSGLKTRSLSITIGSLLELATVIATVWLVFIAGAGPISLSMPIVFFCVVLLFSKESGYFSALLRTRIFRFVGLMSYSIYMIHIFLEYRMLNALTILQKKSGGRLSMVVDVNGHTEIGGSPLFGDVMSVIMLMIAIACAYISYRLIERPAQQWSRRLILGERTRPSLLIAEREAPSF
jgi:peptidoglycan/LPS O-acetylase OafA/YrhL